MKFAHYLATIERDAPEEWKGKFIKYVVLSYCAGDHSADSCCLVFRYKKLKKMLKACLTEDGTLDTAAEQHFFRELREELEFVNKIFFRKADRNVARYQRRTRGVMAWLLSPFLKSERSITEMAKDAYWCRKYARANAVALRKILKKHDKSCQNRLGREFLQQCWAVSSTDEIGVFLHSPLLDELKAVQEKLQMLLDMNVAPDPNADSNQVYPLIPEEKEDEVQMEQNHKGVQYGNLHRCENCLVNEELEDIHKEENYQDPPVAIVPPGLSDTTSLRMMRVEALRAIEESTTCLLDSSDIDWEDDSPAMSEGRQPTSPWPVLRGDGTFEEDAEESKRDQIKPGIDPDAPISSKNRNSDSVHSGSNNHSSIGPGPAKYDDHDLKCPICLELMYRPVGLSCGHKFCRQCALDAAGFGKVFGAFRNIVTYIPARVPCPQCRQAKAYKGAVSLKELGLLIKEKFPFEYAERRIQEREYRKTMFDKPSPIMDRSRPAYPFDLLRV